jgi:predicted transglutaminase-like protease
MCVIHICKCDQRLTYITFIKWIIKWGKTHYTFIISGYISKFMYRSTQIPDTACVATHYIIVILITAVILKTFDSLPRL